MRGRIQEVMRRVERQAVYGDRRQTACGRNPGASPRWQDVHAEVGRDEEIARDRVVGDVGDRLIAEIVVDVRPGRRVAGWVVMYVEHMPRLGRVVGVVT